MTKRTRQIFIDLKATFDVIDSIFNTVYGRLILYENKSGNIEMSRRIKQGEPQPLIFYTNVNKIIKYTKKKQQNFRLHATDIHYRSKSME